MRKKNTTAEDNKKRMNIANIMNIYIYIYIYIYTYIIITILYMARMTQNKNY